MRAHPFLLCLTLLTPPVFAQTPIIIYSESGQRPFSYEENGIAKGAYVDSLRRVLAKLPAYDVEIRFSSWARAVEEARSGNSAGVLGAYYRPGERPFLNHSKSIFKEDVAVHCNRDAVATRHFNHYPADFAGLRFGNQRGYLAPGPEFFAMAKQGKLSVIEGNEFAGLVKKMLVGELDCVINPRLVLDEALATLQSKGLPARMHEKSKYIMTIKTETVHVGFSKKFEEKHPEFAEFRRRFDNAAAE